MSVIARANAAGKAGRPLEARAIVEDAAHRGDPEALVAIAFWRLYGLNGARDWRQAHALLDRAIAANHAPALTLKATLVANGTGVPADWPAAMTLLAKAARRDPKAKAQAGQLDAMAKHAGGDWRAAPPERALPAPETLAAAPHIRVYRGLWTAAECKWMIDAATPGLQPSKIIDPLTGESKPSPIRRAGVCNFGPEREDPVVRALALRIAAVSGTTLAQGEAITVLRYTPGDEYKPHLDTLPGVPNQRAVTVLTYLNDGYAGGATAFTELGLAFEGKRGDVLVFDNVDGEGRPDPRTRHAGAPVTKGVKWLCSRWIRAAPYDPWTDK